MPARTANWQKRKNKRKNTKTVQSKRKKKNRRMYMSAVCGVWCAENILEHEIDRALFDECVRITAFDVERKWPFI